MPFTVLTLRARTRLAGGFRFLTPLIVLALVASACGSDGNSAPALAPAPTEATGVPTPTTSTAAGGESDEPNETDASGDRDEAANSDDQAEGMTAPADSGLPDIGTITELQMGDISCNAAVLDSQWVETYVGATFEMCERAEVLDTTVRLIYSLERVADCESSEPCGESRDELLIIDAVPVGGGWLVMANAEWTVTVGQLGSWAGVNDTGNLTYVGCGPGGGESGCRSLQGGTVNCDGSTCRMTWAEGDSSHVLVGPLAEFGDPGPTTLEVREAGVVSVESTGLAVVDSSDSALLPIEVKFPRGEFGTVVSGAAVRGERIVYAIEVAEGQTMDLSISSLEDNAVFDLIPPSGAAVTREATEFQVSPTVAGFYTLVVGGTRGNATYELSVSVR